MRMLREHSILSFCKHHWNVTFECSLNILKHLKNEHSIDIPRRALVHHFEGTLLVRTFSVSGVTCVKLNRLHLETTVCLTAEHE